MDSEKNRQIEEDCNDNKDEDEEEDEEDEEEEEDEEDEEIDWDYEMDRIMSENRRQQMQSFAYPVLREMADTFESWFPYDEECTEEEKKDMAETFEEINASLSLGEYERNCYEYLYWIRDKCSCNPLYVMAVDMFIQSLSREYGWV